MKTRILTALVLTAAALTLTERAMAQMSEDQLRSARVSDSARVAESLAAAGETRARQAAGPRIVNGQDVVQNSGDWPWVVQIRKDGRHWCGGSLVSPVIADSQVVGWRHGESDPSKLEWVITAAHCMRDRDTGLEIDKSRFMVAAGNVNILDLKTTSIVSFKTHEDYDNITLRDDIAIIRIKPFASLQPSQAFKLSSIRLPAKSEEAWLYKDFAAFTVYGWGRTENSFVSQILQSVRVPYVNAATCLRAHANLGHHKDVLPGMICAGFSSGGFDSCNGDSGSSAAFVPGRAFGDPANEPILAGVVSWGRGCAKPGLYGIYSSTVFYEPWIKKTILAQRAGGVPDGDVAGGSGDDQRQHFPDESGGTHVVVVDIMGERREIEYVNVDGVAMVGGDIEIGDHDQIQLANLANALDRVETMDERVLGDAGLGNVVDRRGRSSVSAEDTARLRAAQQTGTLRWPSTRIPYRIDAGITDAGLRRRIIDAVKAWNASGSIISLVPRTSADPENRVLKFLDPPGNGWSCSARLGYTKGYGGHIRLNPPCPTGTVLHEIFHAVGFMHEHQRRDRGTLIQVGPGFGTGANFGTRGTSWRGSYDLCSLSHYSPGQTPKPGRKWFSLSSAGRKSFNACNLQLRRECRDNEPGQRCQLTPRDIEGIARVYR